MARADMTNLPVPPRRERPARAALAIGFAVAGVACSGAAPTPVAEARPAVQQACERSDAALVGLAGTTPTLQTVSIATTAIRDLWREIPDDETDAGNPNRLIGDEARIVGRRLGDISYSFERGTDFGDADAAAARMVELLADLNEASTEFGLDRCLSNEAADVVVAQVDSVALFAAEIAPTGDYDVDMAAACERLGTASQELIANSLGDPTDRFLVLVRVRRIAERFGADLDRIEPPADRVDAHQALRRTVTRYVSAIGAVEAAQLVSQESLDRAFADFDAVEQELDRQFREGFPDC